MHPFGQEFELSASEIFSAINRRFRAKVALEGIIAEVHLGKHIQQLYKEGIVAKFEEHDLDGYPDYSIWLPNKPGEAYRIECKNVRDADEAYRRQGQIVAFKVETQKTRSSKGDPASRYYNFSQFEILAVCLGKKTHHWQQFMYIQTKFLAPHTNYCDKLAVMHHVPLPNNPSPHPWHNSLKDLLEELT